MLLQNKKVYNLIKRKYTYKIFRFQRDEYRFLIKVIGSKTLNAINYTNISETHSKDFNSFQKYKINNVMALTKAQIRIVTTCSQITNA